jgi:uncharacterized cupredoxin-like copper-binding protein
MKLQRIFILAVISATVVAPVATAASSSTVVNVSGKEFSFTLSRTSGPHGTFVFTFRNIGHVAHDFKIAGKKTPLVQPGHTATLTVTIAKAGRYAYLCTVPGHAAAGMKGIFTVR